MNPTMQPPPQQWNPVMRPEGMRAPPMVEMKPWWQNPMFQQLGQGIAAGAQAAGQGLRQLQEMRPEDVLTPEALDPDEALKQLRMERARQSYERNFGVAHSGGQSRASQGQGVDDLLKRIELARQMHGWKPWRT